MPIVFSGRVFSVEVEQHRYPDGREHEVAIVRHPPSVVLLPIADDGRVILIRQYRPSLAREIWEVPAGSVNAGESPDAAAVRECEEEIGLVPSRVERICGLYPTPGFCDEELIFYRVSALRPPAADSPHRPDDDEDIRPQAFTLDDAQAMVQRGEIVDLKTAYAIGMGRGEGG